ncbi:phosphotransferase family protein [Actinotalea sp. K2]|uniref:phosphotransferase family protein n=1 Tax=Actinotalea sp. K2 TaxID=2939438 RepID=UPI00201770D8|nr:phosphotransferase [Actinotalea sp. K2]MCL3859664.1 aminoglycoside phosphotransferase family protein [Actinotalea sp. K2]
MPAAIGPARVPGVEIPHGSTAQRTTWPSLPATIRALVERRLGRSVVDADSQQGGFTDGFASRLLLADGTRVFVKAISAEQNPQVHPSYLQEIAVASALPPHAPAPHLLWAVEQGDWAVLAFEDVAGRLPTRPWDTDELGRVLDLLPVLASAMTPAPAGLPDLPTTADLDAHFTVWRRHAAAGTVPDGLDPRWHPRVTELAALEADWATLSDGTTAVHFDLRDDNILLGDDGRVLVCDWNWLSLAAPWVDLVGLLVSVHGDGLDAQHLIASHPLSRDVPARSVDAFLCALAGYFVEASARPPVPSSPWLRPHQAWWRDAALDWLGLRLDHLARVTPGPPGAGRG